MGRIFVTGDTHRSIDIAKLSEWAWPEQKTLTKDDYLIILGDFGGVWFESTNGKKKDEKFIRDTYESKPFTTLFLDGNHECHPGLKTYPEEEWMGGRVHRISDSVIHLMRGQVYRINNQKIFTMGGARSIDRYCRIEGTDWWPDEMPSEEEYQEAMNNLEKNEFQVDYILSHCGPADIERMWGFSSDQLSNFFLHLDYDFNLNYKHWYFGHYHRDIRVDDKHTCVYQNIHSLT